jgi:2-amino-4-hydroxy-6-hydroxymethyldihydropteridine diphosphokinase
MSLFIATGTNIGDKKQNLNQAKLELQNFFKLIDESRIYTSKAIEYLNQDDFYNQVLEFETPHQLPDAIMQTLLDIETKMGRVRNISKGPRIIDLDLIFLDQQKIQTNLVKIPHPCTFDRSFVILPLSELQGFKKLQNHFTFSFHFNNEAFPITD